ncbi:hypothetical protein PtB15_3B548 [Puccinia triticina]|nr:hypothetical protein PtB15_3B548 [Puccinia triticina]
MALPTSQSGAEWFAWDEDLFDLDHIFPSGGSSADGDQPFSCGHLPIGLPAGSLASHVYPPQDYYHPIQAATEQRPAGTLAHGKGNLHSLFGSGFEAAQSSELELLADGTPASNGFAAAGASRALNHIFPPALSSEARAAGQADHHQPSSAYHSSPVGLPAGPPSASHHSLLPEFHYPAQMAAKERTVSSQPYHDLDVSFDSGELFEPGFLPHDFDTLAEFLGHGTPDPDGLTRVGAAQSHHGVAHVSDSHSQTFTGPGPSNLPSFLDYTFMPSSGTTSGPHKKRRSRKRKQTVGPGTTSGPHKKRCYRKPKQTVGPVAKSIKPQDLRFNPQRNPWGDMPILDIPFPTSRRPALSKKLPPQGPLGFYLNDFALNNPSVPMEQMEMGQFLTGLRAFETPNPQLVISKWEFHSTHRTYLGLGIAHKDNTRDFKARGNQKPHIDKQVRESHYKRRRRLAKKLADFVSHYKDWYQHWFDETGIDFEKNLLQPHFIGFEDAPVLFPLYLFYVEMICSIVPKEDEATLQMTLLIIADTSLG